MEEVVRKGREKKRRAKYSRRPALEERKLNDGSVYRQLRLKFIISHRRYQQRERKM